MKWPPPTSLCSSVRMVVASLVSRQRLSTLFWPKWCRLPSGNIKRRAFSKTDLHKGRTPQWLFKCFWSMLHAWGVALCFGVRQLILLCISWIDIVLVYLKGKLHMTLIPDKKLVALQIFGKVFAWCLLAMIVEPRFIHSGRPEKKAGYKSGRNIWWVCVSSGSWSHKHKAKSDLQLCSHGHYVGKIITLFKQQLVLVIVVMGMILIVQQLWHWHRFARM